MAIEETVLRPNKSKLILNLLGSLTFVGTGIWMSSNGDWRGYLALIFFGLCALVFAFQLFSNSDQLKITPEYFEYSALRKTHRVHWSQVAEFGIFKQGKFGLKVHEMVVWSYNADVTENQKSRAASRIISGFEAGLPDTYGLSANELLLFMSEHLHRARLETDPAETQNNLTP